jgi:hypothetical protein
MTIRDIIRAAAAHDAVVVDESSGRWAVYQIKSPPGRA